MASPWVPRGTVVHAPSAEVGSAARPFANSQYEHTSILATLKHLYNLPDFLTRRDAWAAPFHDLLSLKTPRIDCPMHLPEAPPPATGAEAACATHGRVQPPELTRRQRRRIERFAAIHGVEVPASYFLYLASYLLLPTSPPLMATPRCQPQRARRRRRRRCGWPRRGASRCAMNSEVVFGCTVHIHLAQRATWQALCNVHAYRGGCGR